MKPGRPAKPWEWQRAILRREWWEDDLASYRTPRRGQRLKATTVKLVACTVAGRMNADGKCYPSQGLLAADSSLDRKTIGDAVACLEHFGWLRVYRDETDDGRKRGTATRSNSYYACIPKQDMGSQTPAVVGGHGVPDPGTGGRRRAPDPTKTQKIQGGAPSDARPSPEVGAVASAGVAVGELENQTPIGHNAQEATCPQCDRPLDHPGDHMAWDAEANAWAAMPQPPAPEPPELTCCMACIRTITRTASRCPYCLGSLTTMPREVADRRMAEKRTERAARMHQEHLAKQREVAACPNGCGYDDEPPFPKTCPNCDDELVVQPLASLTAA